MNFDKCEVCDMVFHDVGTIPGRKRLDDKNEKRFWKAKE